MRNELRILFLVVILLGMVCGGEIHGVFATTTVVDWSSTPTITETEVNATFSPIVNVYMGEKSVDAKKIYGTWSPATAEFLSLWDSLEIEIIVSANGIDYGKIVNSQISLDGKNWNDCKFSENKGYAIRGKIRDLITSREGKEYLEKCKAQGIIPDQNELSKYISYGGSEIKMRLAGYFRQHRLQVLILTFRWTSMQNLTGVLHLNIKETPEGCEKLGRFDVYSYPSRAIEGVIPAWTEPPKKIYPGREKLTIEVVDQSGNPFLGKTSFQLRYSSLCGNDKMINFTLEGNSLRINGKAYKIPDTAKFTYTSPANVGSFVSVKFENQDWSTPQILLKGQELKLKFVAVQGSVSATSITQSLLRHASYYWAWSRMNGDPRFFGIICDDEKSTAEEKAKLYFQSSFSAKDMYLHGFTFAQIQQFKEWAKEYGVEKHTYHNGDVIDSGMTFGRLVDYRPGPILVSPTGVSEVNVFFVKTPEDYNGKVPGIVGPSVSFSGEIVPGCTNMIAVQLRIFVKKYWFCLGAIVYTATEQPVIITMKSPEQPVAYIGFDRPTYTQVTTAIATFSKTTIPDFNISVDARSFVDARTFTNIGIDNIINNEVLAQIFNNLDILNVISNEIKTNIINQILNIINNANADG